MTHGYWVGIDYIHHAEGVNKDVLGLCFAPQEKLCGGEGASGRKGVLPQSRLPETHEEEEEEGVPESIGGRLRHRRHSEAAFQFVFTPERGQISSVLLNNEKIAFRKFSMIFPPLFTTSVILGGENGWEGREQTRQRRLANMNPFRGSYWFVGKIHFLSLFLFFWWRWRH